MDAAKREVMENGSPKKRKHRKGVEGTRGPPEQDSWATTHGALRESSAQHPGDSRSKISGEASQLTSEKRDGRNPS